MAADQNIGKEISDNLDRLVIGGDRVLKLLRQGGLKKVFASKNCPLRLVQSLSRYARLAQVPFVQLEQNNEEVGLLCKRNFAVAVVGLN